MKKIMYLIIAAVLILGSFTACGTPAETAEPAADNEPIQIVTTIFPEYDWVNSILGENPAGAEVTLLLDSGVDLHSYQPTAEDILKISTCDLFIYVGGESDEWVEDALAGATNEEMKVINMMDVLGDSVKEEEVIEGMQGEEHEHEECEEHEHEHGEGPEYDEHVWLSLKNAVALVSSFSEAIQEIDADNAEFYKANTDAYIAELSALDDEYEAAVSESAHKTILFGDRFPFRYMVDDYGLDYFAAFVGCSAETEASFETITFLAKKVDSLGLPVVLTIEGADHRIAETIVENTKTHNQQILTMDSLQSTTSSDIENGATYLKAMENNLIVLKEALK